MLGNVRNEILYNNFHYGSQRGTVLEEENGSGPSGISLGLGVDGAKRAMDFEALGGEGFEFINSQIVSIGGGQDTRYIETGSNFKGEASFYSSDYWGGPAFGIAIRAGKVSFQLAHFHNPGLNGFAVLDEGSLIMDISSVGSTQAFVNRGAESQLSVRSSIATPVGIISKNTTLWQFNLGNYAIEAPKSSQSQENKSEDLPSPSANSSESAALISANSSNGKANSMLSPFVYFLIIVVSAILIVISIGAVKKAKSK